PGGHPDTPHPPPPPADLSFTPPAGATVSQVNLTGGNGQAQDAKGHAPYGVTTIGDGWLTVLKLPSAAVTAGSGGSSDDARVLNALLGSATQVHGAWGSGRLIRTSLGTVLMTDPGSTFAGSVQPSVLYAAAAR